MSTDLMIAEVSPSSRKSICPLDAASVVSSSERASSTERSEEPGQGGALVTPSAAAIGSKTLPAAEASASERHPLAVAFADFLQLTKPRIVVMILVTTIASAVLAGGAPLAASQLVWLLIGTALVAGSAGAANQVWERVIDQRMARTATRPLPAGRRAAVDAWLFTAVTGIVGTAILAAGFGVTPAAVGVLTWLLYVLVYTPMKTRTAWNTTVGAVAGAIPVLIGYTAAGGTLTGPAGWLLVGVLVAWQYPHFMAIAWMYRHQYAKAGFCMTTTVEPTGRSAGWQSIAGSLAIIGCAVALCLGASSLLGAAAASVAATLCSLPMLVQSIRFTRRPGDGQARKLLRSSLLVLPAVLLIVTLSVFW